jgi:hypothetical protein
MGGAQSLFSGRWGTLKESRASATRIGKNFGSIAAVERGNLL